MKKKLPITKNKDVVGGDGAGRSGYEFQHGVGAAAVLSC